MSKKDIVYRLNATENTLRQMPKFNPYQVGHGSHGTKGYNRRRNKREFRKMLDEAL